MHWVLDRRIDNCLIFEEKIVFYTDERRTNMKIAVLYRISEVLAFREEGTVRKVWTE